MAYIGTRSMVTGSCVPQRCDNIGQQRWYDACICKNRVTDCVMTIVYTV